MRPPKCLKDFEARKAARVNNQNKYLGLKCSTHPNSLRYTSSGACIECQKQLSKACPNSTGNRYKNDPEYRELYKKKRMELYYAGKLQECVQNSLS